MGGKLTELDNSIIREVDDKSNGDGSTGGTSTASSETSGRGKGSGGTDTASGGGNTEKGNTVSKADELSLLTDEERTRYATANETERKKILKNAKRRQRYAEQKQAKGQNVKPRKVNGTKNSTVPPLDVTQLNLIIAGISSAIASRPNCSHWLLTPEEINSITVPLSKMIAESEALAGMGQYSNQIALVMACLTVFAPRLFITAQMTKEAKKLERTGQHTDTNYRDGKSGTVGKTKGSDSKSDNGNNRVASSNNTNTDKNIPFYGVPIA